MFNVKKFLTALMCGVFVTNTLGLSAFSASAATGDSRTFVYDDYEITYNVTNSWGNTDAVTVSITNTGNETIENWMLYFDPNGDISSNNLWNAQTALTTSGITYFTNAGYNSAILPNATVNFSYFVDNCEAMPDAFIMCQKRAENTEYYAYVIVDGAWDNNFNGTIVLTNNSDNPIKDWELTFDTNFTITEITSSWAGTMSTLEPYSYMLKGSYTNVIAPHTSVQLGFSGVKNGTPDIISSTLTEVVVDEDVIFEHIVLQDDCIDWSDLPDTDGDGLPDEYELEYGCDANNSDSDGDGLPDGYEILKVGSDPANAHSLSATLTDGECDNDSDGLTNIREYQLGTDPLVADSDYDGLTDGLETSTYLSNPLDEDTDADGISDGDEIALGLNPLLADSDNDGVFDNEEQFSQSIAFDGAESDDLINEISISFNGTGYINSTTSIKSVMNVDWMCSNVVGLIGEPYDLSTTSEFEEATISFAVDSTALGNTDFEDLIVLWYNETDQRFVDMEATHDSINNALIFTTPHLSKYLIVDCNEWYDAWSENNYPDNGNILHTAITIDCSTSTEYTDPDFYRVTAANSFVDVMKAADLASVIFFADGAEIKQSLTDDKEALHTAVNQVFSAGTTNYEAAITRSMNALSANQNNNAENIIIFLSDGAPTEIVDGHGIPISPEDFDYSIIDEVADAGIKIYTIGLSTTPGSNGETILQEIADRTNGEYYYAATADELVTHFLTINMSKKYDITTDTDEDELPDLFETYGMPIANGQVIFTSAYDDDSDNDGLTDGEEIVMHVVDNANEVKNAYKYMYDFIPNVFISGNGGIYFELVTDPTNDDTDGDGIVDGNEVENVTTDSRYNNLNPLVKDTLESLFVEYHQDTMINQRNNAVYIQIDQNTVTINARIKYTNAYNELASSYITWNDEESQDIYNSLSEDCTLKDLFEDGVKRRWGGLYSGTKYDFYPGLSINVDIKFINYNENTMTDCRYITANLTNTIGGVSSTSGGYDTTENKTITMKSLGDLASIYEGICAHEFGHTLLLADAYPSQNNNFNAAYSTNPADELYSIISNETYGRHGAGEIMYYNGDVLANDVEMVLFGYSTNTKQYFVPSSNRNVSPAIRQSDIYYNESDKCLYKWNGTEMILYTGEN